MKRLLLTIGLALVVLASAGSSGASTGAADLQPCASGSDVLCTTVTVPLDRSGHHAGSVRLHVEVLPADGSHTLDPAHRAIFLVAGGPGQGSADAFDLADYSTYWQPIFPGYTIVAFDDRGTGRSGQLACPGLAAIVNAGVERSAREVGKCGRRLGTRGAFYTTRANADDTDAVRHALGLDRISLYGVSYGSKQVAAYALRHPTHAQRLVLDSVAPVDTVDSYSTQTLQAIPGSLASLCAGSACRGLRRELGAGLADLANRLATDPLTGSIPRPGSRPLRIHLNGLQLIELALDSDLNSGVAAELPAALTSALDGHPAPLLRLSGLDTIWGTALFGGIDLAVNVATECNDGYDGFPWPPATPVGKRTALLRAAIAALPQGSSGLFGPWASLSGLAQQCKYWPRPAAGADLGHEPMPDVPVLVLSGDRDVRTPTADARRVAASFRHSRLLLVRGSGHDVLDASPCAQRFVAAWLNGTKHGSCPRVTPELAPLGPFPAPAAVSGGPPLSPAETLAIAAETLREAEATWLATYGISRRLAGPAGGSLQPRSDQASFALTDYAERRGVALDGTISYDPSRKGTWTGEIAVSGRRAAAGSLAVHDGRLSGALGGRPVSGPAAGG